MSHLFPKKHTAKNSSNGFAMPMILTFIFLIGVVGTSLVQSSVQTNGSAVLHSQVQIAHIASKAAIDFAEEQYELNAAYTGTAEQDLFSNDFYRATIEVVILYDQSATAKRVQGIGRVYIPETSSSARVVRDIKSTIIRNGEVISAAGITDPASFNPLLWLDANHQNSLFSGSPGNTQTIDALYGTTSKDVVEEGGSDATSAPNRGKLDFGNDDLDMAWGGNSVGTQAVGIRFRGVNPPKNATIDSAYIQFTTDKTLTAGVVQLRVAGIAADNPGQWNGNYAVSSATKTAATVTWQPPNWNIVGSNGANERVDITAIVQELVNRSGWSSGNAMSFAISWINGSGVRTAEKGAGGNPAPQLFIQWNSSLASPSTTDGSVVSQWYDRSGNGYNATTAFGTSPILKTNQINGLNAVRFSSDGVLKSTLSPVLSSNKELVSFMVMKPRVSAVTNARFLSVMNSSQNSDSNTANGLIPFMQNATTSTLQQMYNNTVGETLAGAIDDSWAIYSSQLSNSYSERLVKNSTPDNTSARFTVNYSVDQVYIGGSRATAAGANYTDMDVAEIIVYNRSFACSEIQQIENYLADKYAISIVEKNPCP